MNNRGKQVDQLLASMTEADLIDLNRRIVERLKMMQVLRSHQQMMQFSVGQRVCFDSPNSGTVIGIITRYNRKTVTLLADDGAQWNVAPGFLRAADPPLAQRVDLG